MFEDSLIESGGKLKTKRGWTTILSFVFQVVIVGVMILIPLIFTEALPKRQLMMFSGGPASASTPATAAGCGSGQGREADPDRHCERPAAHAYQDSQESPDD